jgi:hypothetical protein
MTIEEGQLDTSNGHADPAGFEDGDEIDSAAVDEPDDGFEPPADPGTEPTDPDDDGAGDD